MKFVKIASVPFILGVILSPLVFAYGFTSVEGSPPPNTMANVESTRFEEVCKKPNGQPEPGGNGRSSTQVAWVGYCLK